MQDIPPITKENNVSDDDVTVELEEDYEPTDQEMMSAFGTKWHDGL